MLQSIVKPSLIIHCQFAYFVGYKREKKVLKTENESVKMLKEV